MGGPPGTGAHPHPRSREPCTEVWRGGGEGGAHRQGQKTFARSHLVFSVCLSDCHQPPLQTSDRHLGKRPAPRPPPPPPHYVGMGGRQVLLTSPRFSVSPRHSSSGATSQDVHPGHRTGVCARVSPGSTRVPTAVVSSIRPQPIKRGASAACLILLHHLGQQPPHLAEGEAFALIPADRRACHMTFREDDLQSGHRQRAAASLWGACHPGQKQRAVPLRRAELSPQPRLRPGV